MRRVAPLLLAAALGVANLGATPYQRPAGIADDSEPLIVAGYRALFTCSAHFFAGRPLEDIKKVELVDVGELGDGGIAAVPILLQRLHRDPVEVAAQLALQVRQVGPPVSRRLRAGAFR